MHKWAACQPLTGLFLLPVTAPAGFFEYVAPAPGSVITTADVGMMAGECPVRFSHLKLENWRNFRFVDVSLKQRVFLVGPNASGKSNLLDAFRFLRELADPQGGLQRALSKPRGSISQIRSLHARRYPNEIGRAHV